MALRAEQRVTSPAAAQLIQKARLPRPSPRTRVRKEVVLRPASSADSAACALIDAAYTTTHVWQLDARTDADELRVSLRWLRLPRELTLVAPHVPPATYAAQAAQGAPAGSGAAQRRGVLWLVADEVEVGGPPGADDSAPRVARAVPAAPAAPAAPAVPAAAPWSHALRRSTNGATVQLSLPSSPGTVAGAGRSDAVPAGPEPAAPGGRAPHGQTGKAGNIVGYVVVAAVPRDRNAYLRTLVVDRAHRRKGTGGRLLAEAKRWAMHQGADCLIADAPARNFPAIRLLQKSGFVFCGYNDSCYLDNEVAVFFCARLR